MHDKEMLTFFAHLFWSSSPAGIIAIHNIFIRERFVYFACVFCAKPELLLVCLVVWVSLYAHDHFILNKV